MEGEYTEIEFEFKRLQIVYTRPLWLVSHRNNLFNFETT